MVEIYILVRKRKETKEERKYLVKDQENCWRLGLITLMIIKTKRSSNGRGCNETNF